MVIDFWRYPIQLFYSPTCQLSVAAFFFSYMRWAERERKGTKERTSPVISIKWSDTRSNICYKLDAKDGRLHVRLMKRRSAVSSESPDSEWEIISSNSVEWSNCRENETHRVAVIRSWLNWYLVSIQIIITTTSRLMYIIVHVCQRRDMSLADVIETRGYIGTGKLNFL